MHREPPRARGLKETPRDAAPQRSLRCLFLRLGYAALEAETRKGGSDEELLAWAFAHGRPPDEQEIEVGNAFLTNAAGAMPGRRL